MATTTRLLTYLVLISVIFSSRLTAQINLTEENADCYGAVVIQDSIFGPVFPGTGHGHILEIKKNHHSDPLYFQKEHHTIWYEFRAPWACTMTFDIIPENPKDDLDFMLFEGAVVDFCHDVMTKHQRPIRSNIARNDPANGSRTGLSHTATKDYVKSGPDQDPYSRAMEVEKGELLYLVVDQSTKPKGPYTIHFHWGPMPPEEKALAEKPKDQKVKISVVDSETGDPIIASLAVEGLEFAKVTSFENKHTYETETYRGTGLNISAIKSGYMVAEERVKASMDESLEVEIRMLALRAGTKINMEGIQFVGNENVILRRSFKAIKKIEFFMKQNPAVHIEIQGHVNGPNRRNSKGLQMLSENRAKAVYLELIRNGVDKDRMSFKGFGNSEMVHPEPKDARESAMNRRVEVRIIENDEFTEDVAEQLPLSDE